MVSQFHARQDNRIHANPTIVANSYWACPNVAREVVGIMVSADQPNVLRDQRIVTDFDTVSALDIATVGTPRALPIPMRMRRACVTIDVRCMGQYAAQLNPSTFCMSMPRNVMGAVVPEVRTTSRSIGRRSVVYLNARAISPIIDNR